MMSLHGRVALSAGVVLVVFMVLTGVALDRAFHESVRGARQERLLGQLYLLMAAADVDPDGEFVVPDPLAEAAFSLPGSGLYGEISDEGGATVWRSASTIGVAPPFETRLAKGQRRFAERRDASGNPYLVESYGVSWATGDAPRIYTFSVAEDLGEFNREVNHFRTSLAAWLSGFSVVLLALLAVVLRWGLKPLRTVAEEIRSVQAGRQERVEGSYPRELTGLTDNLNALVTRERARGKRLRDSLGDLAHSLKTPLAVLRGSIAESRIEKSAAAEMDEQIERMDRIVEHQLHRAIAGGQLRLGALIPVAPLAEKLARATQKLHRDRNLTVRVEASPGASFRGAEGDLMEVLGNLIDNACKWCRGQVLVGAARRSGILEIRVEDDGSGIEPGPAAQLLQRGVRADEAVPGHGIGLAVVREIAAAYDGEVIIERSSLGGAAIVVRMRD